LKQKNSNVYLRVILYLVVQGMFKITHKMSTTEHFSFQGHNFKPVVLAPYCIIYGEFEQCGEIKKCKKCSKSVNFISVPTDKWDSDYCIGCWMNEYPKCAIELMKLAEMQFDKSDKLWLKENAED
jgi:hypothetical protein